MNVTMDKDSKDALDETRQVLRDLSKFLIAVDKQRGPEAHPALVSFADRIQMVVGEIDGIQADAPRSKKTA